MASGGFSAVLFDNDGVLVDSTGHVDECWGTMCDRHGLDRAAVLADFHGRPALETLSRFLEGERLHAAFDDLLELEIEASAHTAAMPGAIEIISALVNMSCAHTIATSATAELARVRLTAAGVPIRPRWSPSTTSARASPLPTPTSWQPSAWACRSSGASSSRTRRAASGPGSPPGATVVAVATTHDPGELTAAHHVVPGLPALIERIRRSV